MPTVGERLATLEATAQANREKIEQLLDMIGGGGDTSYDRSVRGRLHKIEGTLGGMVLRRSYGVGFLKGWERAVLVLCGIATAAAAWYSVVAK